MPRIDPLQPDRFVGVATSADLAPLTPLVKPDRRYLERDFDVMAKTHRASEVEKDVASWADGIVKQLPRNGPWSSRQPARSPIMLWHKVFFSGTNGKPSGQ